jgi:hypothetical protein
MPSIITWITQHCRYCQESNLYSCSQNTISRIFSGQHYIQPLQMDLLLLFLFLMSKPLWLHFLMIPCEENFASNYDIFTGNAKLPTSTLDETLTGSLWEQARQKYCGDEPGAFPLALVCFYDKTNTDVFGSLSCAPFICTPLILNKDCCNDDSNNMVLGYIPNLGYRQADRAYGLEICQRSFVISFVILYVCNIVQYW